MLAFSVMTPSRASSEVRVLHSHPVWLPQTMTWLYYQIKYLPGEVDNRIVCEETQNLDQFDLPNIHCLGSRGLWGRVRRWRIRGLKCLAQVLWLWQNCRQFRPHIIHSHFGNVGYFNSWVLRMMPVKHVVTFYGADVNMFPTQDPRWRRRYRSLFASADLFLCEGPHMGQCLAQLGCSKNKVRVHHLGVEVDKIPFRPREWRKSEPLRVLIASTFREKKGIPYAIEALGRVQHEVALEITVIGDATEEPRSLAEKNSILKSVERFGLQRRVRFLGFQPHRVLMEEAYRSHIFVAPSVTGSDGDTEGGAPVSLIEMAASGMPIVSTKHCDIPEVLPEGTAALLVAERSATALAGALKSLTDHWPEISACLPKTRSYIEQAYSANKQGIALGKVYRMVAGLEPWSRNGTQAKSSGCGFNPPENSNAT
jgi:colanic acid/amylovoran biosynthesis glycosyltransferase